MLIKSNIFTTGFVLMPCGKAIDNPIFSNDAGFSHSLPSSPTCLILLDKDTAHMCSAMLLYCSPCQNGGCKQWQWTRLSRQPVVPTSFDEPAATYILDPICCMRPHLLYATPAVVWGPVYWGPSCSAIHVTLI